MGKFVSQLGTWPAATRVFLPTTKGGREERPWERGWTFLSRLHCACTKRCGLTLPWSRERENVGFHVAIACRTGVIFAYLREQGLTRPQSSLIVSLLHFSPPVDSRFLHRARDDWGRVRNRGESEASAKRELRAWGGSLKIPFLALLLSHATRARHALASLSPLFAWNTQKITPVLGRVVQSPIKLTQG